MYRVITKGNPKGPISRTPNPNPNPNPNPGNLKYQLPSQTTLARSLKPQGRFR